MIACADVDYRGREGVAACVLFRDWQAARSSDEIVVRVRQVEAYQPGLFFKRELPCLLEVLARATCALDAVIVDGYVWLSHERGPGLGAHLYRALMEQVPVIGVAKTRFAQAVPSTPILRGRSKRPLYVSAAGMGSPEAAKRIRSMHGPFRIPTLLARADRLCREG
jgi:deoxyribonuclease V